MGVFDSVYAPCPECGARHEFQSKSGDGALAAHDLEVAPAAILADANRHAPVACRRCGTRYRIAPGRATVRENEAR